MDISILEEQGLTKNEAIIYLTLIKMKETTTGPLIKETNLASSRVYASLERLIKRGLVTFYRKNNIKYFKAENLNNLLKLLEEKRRKVQTLILQAKQLKFQDREEYSTIYEGYNGFKNAFEKMIDLCNSKDEILTFGFSNHHNINSLRLFLKQVDKKRINKKVHMRIIFDLGMKKIIGKDREKEIYTKVKYMYSNYFSPAAMNIFKDYVMIETWGEKPVVLFIKNKEIAESFRQYFNSLWKVAK